MHMLSTDLSLVAVGTALLSLAISGIACFFAFRRTETLTLTRKIGRVEVAQGLLEEQATGLMAAWKRANARMAMAEARAAKRNQADDGEPDPQTDPEAWRATVRERFSRH